jgi:regulator of protease activity HflC (stomatin/prohibitin superfamily)
MPPLSIQTLQPYLPYLIGVLVALFVLRAIRVAQEYERAVIFSFGRVTRRPRGPGLYLIWPWERAQKVDIRINTLGIQPQDCITNDNVTVRVDAVAYFFVNNPIRASVNVRDYMQATLQIAQTSLRSVIGQVELDQLLAHRNEINMRIREIIDKQTEAWGIEVSVVEVKDIELPEMMQRAMARQAEAEREKRAKIIHAQGEFQAAQQLQEAAATMSKEPAALQLRYLQTLTEIAAEKNSTIIFPMPMDLVPAIGQAMKGFQNAGQHSVDNGGTNDGYPPFRAQ